VAPIGGALADRIGSRLVTIAGLSLIALGCASFVTVDQHLSVLGLRAACHADRRGHGAVQRCEQQ
jgi:MFS family permease